MRGCQIKMKSKLVKSSRIYAKTTTMIINTIPILIPNTMIVSTILKKVSNTTTCHTRMMMIVTILIMIRRIIPKTITHHTRVMIIVIPTILITNPGKFLILIKNATTTIPIIIPNTMIINAILTIDPNVSLTEKKFCCREKLTCALADHFGPLGDKGIGAPPSSVRTTSRRTSFPNTLLGFVTKVLCCKFVLLKREKYV